MSDERKGAISMSAAPQLARCPGAAELQKGMPDKSSKESRAGDVMHQAAAGKDVALTPDEADLVRRMVEHETTVRMMVFGTDPIHVIEREMRLWSNNKKFSGQPDVVMVDGGTALVLDYKTGRIPVAQAADNWQLKGYATLVAQSWPVNRVFVSIVQPMCGEPTLHKYEGESLKKVRRDIHALVRRASKPNAKLNPGEVQCKYCKAKPICPALQQESLSLVRGGTDVAVFDGRRLSELLDRCKPVEDFIKALRERARELLSEKEGAVPGYRLKDGTRRRKITDNKKAYSVLADSGVPFDDILSTVTFSVAKIERLARERDSLNAYEARELVEEALSGVIEVSESEPKLDRGYKCQTAS